VTLRAGPERRSAVVAAYEGEQAGSKRDDGGGEQEVAPDQ